MNFNHSFNNLIQKVNKYNLRSFNFQFRIQNDSHFMGQNKKISRYWTRSFLKKLKFYKHIKVFIRSYPRPRYYFRRFKKSIKIYKHVLKTTVNFVKFTTINKLQFKNSIVEDPNVFRRKYIVFIRHRYSRLVKAFNKINKFTVSLAEYNDAKKKLLKKSQLKKKLSLGKVFFRNPWIMRFHRFNKSRINATLRSSLKYQVKFKKRLAKKEINNFLKFMVWFRYYFHKFLAKGKVIKFNDNLKLISVVFKEVVFFYFYFKLAFLSIHSDLTEITKFEQADFSEIYKKVAKEARISSYFKNKRLKWRKRQKKKKSKTPLQLKLLKIVSVLGDVGKSSKKKKKKDQRLIVKQKKKDNKNFNQIFKKNQIQSSSKLKLSESKLEHVLTHFYKIKIPSVREIKKKTKYKKKLKLRSKKTKGNLKTKLNLLIKNKSKNINRKKSMKKVLVKKKINDLIFFKDKRGLNDIVKRFLPKLNKKLVLKFKLKRLKDGEALDYNILRKKKKSKFKKSNRNIQKTKFSKFKKSNINFSYQAPIYVIDLLRGLKIPLPLAFKKFLTLKSKNSFSLLKALGFKILTKDVLKLKQKIKYILQQVKRFYWNLKSSEKTINLKVIKGIYKFLNQLKFIFAKKYFYKMSLRKLVKKIDFCVSGLARFNLKKLIRVKPVSKNLNKNILTFKKSFKLKRKVLVQRNKILTLFNLIKATIIKLNNRPRSGIKKILPYFNYRVLSLNRNGVVIYKALHKSIMNKNFHRLGFKRFMSQFEGLDSINKENLNNGLNYFNTKFKKTFTSSNFNVYQFCEKTTQIDESFYSSFVNWLYLKPKFNVIFSKSNIRPYNLWIFFLNYSINYYKYIKLQFFFLTYLFYIINQKFNKVVTLLRLKGFELVYNLVKRKDKTRSYLGIRPETFVTTFNRRVKLGFSVKHILKDITYLLNRYLTKNKIKGYYIRIKGRFQRGRRKAKFVRRKGVIAFNTLDLKLNSCYGLLHTRFGISGVKIVFAY